MSEHRDAMRSLAAFLSGEHAQVWAVDKTTEAYFYLPEGLAEALRDFAKTSLRCPYPGCTSTLTTAGGTKRDHFRHMGATPHETGPESENHLAGKAMLSQWLAGVVPPGATVVEEQSVKTKTNAMTRRADVMVTGQSGRRVAFEVEYKSFPISEWAFKQADYEAQQVACAWLIGHTKITLPEDAGDRPLVKVPRLAQEIASRLHRPVLVINPMRREVGVLADNPTFARYYRGYDNRAWLAVDRIDECDFDPHRGIITPTMRAIDERERRRIEHERQAEEARAAGTESTRRYWGAREPVGQWTISPLRQRFMTRWGCVPEPLGHPVERDDVIGAVPVHWQAALYDNLLHEHGPGFKFWHGTMLNVLDTHRIECRRGGNVIEPLTAFMEVLEPLGLVRIVRDFRGRVVEFYATTKQIGPDGTIVVKEPYASWT